MQHESHVRAQGLLFILLASIIGIASVALPAESSITSNPTSNLVAGGIAKSTEATTKERLSAILASDQSLADLYGFYGINEAVIQNTSLSEVTTDQSLRLISRQSHGIGAETCTLASLNHVCERNIKASYNNQVKTEAALIGTTEQASGGQWFAVILSSGNIAFRQADATELSISISEELTDDTSDHALVRVDVFNPTSGVASSPTLAISLPDSVSYIDHYPKDLFDSQSTDKNTVSLESDSDNGIGSNDTRSLWFVLGTSGAGSSNEEHCLDASVVTKYAQAVTFESLCISVEEKTTYHDCSHIDFMKLESLDTNSTYKFTTSDQSVDYELIDESGNSYQLNSDDLSTTYSVPNGEHQVSIAPIESIGATAPCPISFQAPDNDPGNSYCESFRLTSTRDNTYTFAMTHTHPEGATPTRHIIEYGDGTSSQLTATSSSNLVFEHTYNQPGDKRVLVTTESTINNQIESATCSLEVFVQDQACADCNTTSPQVADDALAMITNRLSLSTEPSGGDQQVSTISAGSGQTVFATLHATNVGIATADAGFALNIGDALEYAEVIDTQGATVDAVTKILSWETTPLDPGDTTTKTVTLRLFSMTPNTPSAESDPLSFDTTIDLYYGNNAQITVNKNLLKQLESIVSRLPVIPPALSIAATTLLFASTLYLYLRARIIAKELPLIKNEFTGGKS